jgi:hypothetical protein
MIDTHVANRGPLLASAAQRTLCSGLSRCFTGPGTTPTIEAQWLPTECRRSFRATRRTILLVTLGRHRGFGPG